MEDIVGFMLILLIVIFMTMAFLPLPEKTKGANIHSLEEDDPPWAEYET